MTPVEAAQALREAQRTDPHLTRAIAGAVQRAGCADMYEWADQNPEQAIALAESVADIDGQINVFEEKLSHGDLS